MKHKCLAIVTARGGSKRIPRKNIKNFLGKPIIAYPLEAALQSELFEEVIVSTDDEEIASVAKKYGATVPFMRSSKNADDYASTADVIDEVLERYREKGVTFDYVCCIYPTAPFLTKEILEQSFWELLEKKGQSLVPVVRFGFPIQRAVKIENGRMKMFQPEHIVTRSQDLTPSFHDCGQFYWVSYQAFLQQKKLYTDDTIAFEVDEMRVQDIDNLKDWEIAEFKYQLMKNDGQK